MKCLSNNNEEKYQIKVIMLDGAELNYEITNETKTQDLLDLIFKQLNLVENIFFGLRKGQSVGEIRRFTWLFNNSRIIKQINLNQTKPICLHFGVKFYIEDPCKLKDESTRYQFFLQLRKNILIGKLILPFELSPQLFAYTLQSELGDYDGEIHEENYSSNYKFVFNQDKKLEQKAEELHKTLIGQMPALVEINFLDKVKQLELYGTELHPVLGEDEEENFFGLSPSGVVVLHKNALFAHYVWASIIGVYKKGKYFIIKVFNKNNEKTTYGFELLNKMSCKYLWKSCVEYQLFVKIIQTHFKNEKNLIQQDYLYSDYSHDYNTRLDEHLDKLTLRFRTINLNTMMIKKRTSMHNILSNFFKQFQNQKDAIKTDLLTGINFNSDLYGTNKEEDKVLSQKSSEQTDVQMKDNAGQVKPYTSISRTFSIPNDLYYVNNLKTSCSYSNLNKSIYSARLNKKNFGTCRSNREKYLGKNDLFDETQSMFSIINLQTNENKSCNSVRSYSSRAAYSDFNHKNKSNYYRNSNCFNRHSNHSNYHHHHYHHRHENKHSSSRHCRYVHSNKHFSKHCNHHHNHRNSFRKTKYEINCDRKLNYYLHEKDEFNENSDYYSETNPKEKYSNCKHNLIKKCNQHKSQASKFCKEDSCCGHLDCKYKFSKNFCNVKKINNYSDEYESDAEIQSNSSSSDSLDESDFTDKEELNSLCSSIHSSKHVCNKTRKTFKKTFSKQNKSFNLDKKQLKNKNCYLNGLNQKEFNKSILDKQNLEHEKDELKINDENIQINQFDLDEDEEDTQSELSYCSHQSKKSKYSLYSQQKLCSKPRRCLNYNKKTNAHSNRSCCDLSSSCSEYEDYQSLDSNYSNENYNRSYHRHRSQHHHRNHHNSYCRNQLKDKLFTKYDTDRALNESLHRKSIKNCSKKTSKKNESTLNISNNSNQIIQSNVLLGYCDQAYKNQQKCLQQKPNIVSVSNVSKLNSTCSQQPKRANANIEPCQTYSNLIVDYQNIESKQQFDTVQHMRRKIFRKINANNIISDVNNDNIIRNNNSQDNCIINSNLNNKNSNNNTANGTNCNKNIKNTDHNLKEDLNKIDQEARCNKLQVNSNCTEISNENSSVYNSFSNYNNQIKPSLIEKQNDNLTNNSNTPKQFNYSLNSTNLYKDSLPVVNSKLVLNKNCQNLERIADSNNLLVFRSAKNSEKPLLPPRNSSKVPPPLPKTSYSNLPDKIINCSSQDVTTELSVLNQNLNTQINNKNSTSSSNSINTIRDVLYAKTNKSFKIIKSNTCIENRNFNFNNLNANYLHSASSNLNSLMSTRGNGTNESLQNLTMPDNGIFISPTLNQANLSNFLIDKTHANYNNLKLTQKSSAFQLNPNSSLKFYEINTQNEFQTNFQNRLPVLDKSITAPTSDINMLTCYEISTEL